MAQFFSLSPRKSWFNRNELYSRPFFCPEAKKKIENLFLNWAKTSGIFSIYNCWIAAKISFRKSRVHFQLFFMHFSALVWLISLSNFFCFAEIYPSEFSVFLKLSVVAFFNFIPYSQYSTYSFFPFFSYFLTIFCYFLTFLTTFWLLSGYFLTAFRLLFHYFFASIWPLLSYFLALTGQFFILKTFHFWHFEYVSDTFLIRFWVFSVLSYIPNFLSFDSVFSALSQLTFCKNNFFFSVFFFRVSFFVSGSQQTQL